MAKRPLIEAQPRTETGKRAMVRLRKSGSVPAVMYGSGVATEHLMVNEEAMRAVLESRSRMVEVKVGDNTQPAVLKDVQFDHLGSDLYHIDFERINLSEVVRVQVPVETHGVPKGSKNGGVMSVSHRHVTVECTAGDVPNEILVEVGDLDIGQMLTVAQLALPQGVRLVDDPGTVVISIQAPRSEEEITAPEAETEMAEPEVITARKPEEEEEEE
jgi:large subunit ribosomal protein L25